MTRVKVDFFCRTCSLVVTLFVSRDEDDWDEERFLHCPTCNARRAFGVLLPRWTKRRPLDFLNVE